MPERDPKDGAAFLFIKLNNFYVVAFAGDDITDCKGEIIPALKGVKITGVSLNKVVFNNKGKREELGVR